MDISQRLRDDLQIIEKYLTIYDLCKGDDNPLYDSDHQAWLRRQIETLLQAIRWADLLDVLRIVYAWVKEHSPKPPAGKEGKP